MISIKTVIVEALREIGAVSWNEEAEGDDAKIAESILNQVVAGLNQEQLLPFSRVITNFTVTAPQRVFTIGQVPSPGTPADIVADRPLHLTGVYWVPSGSSTPSELIGVDLASLITRGTTTASTGMPSIFAYNPTYPAGEIHLDINPSPGGALRILANKSLEIVNSNSKPAWPPEYTQLLILALARKLGSRRQAPADTLANIDALYKEELSILKYSNSRNQMGLLELGVRPGRNGWKGNILAGY